MYIDSLHIETTMPIAPESIASLKTSISDDALVITPESPGYGEIIKRWSAAAEKPASIIVCPITSEDVSKAVLFATRNNLDLAVCGGGHATSGSSSTDGGLCIDLSKMCHVSVHLDTKTVVAEGGCLWKDVDEEASKYGLATVGGTVNHTGVGGLTLGGGYGWLNGAHGLVIDNLAAVEMVLADGAIVDANASTNEDLFWAIRGAGTSFGVATKFFYHAHEQRVLVWAAILSFPSDHLAQCVEAANQILQIADPNSMHLLGFGTQRQDSASKPDRTIIVVLFYNGTESDARSLYEPFLKMDASSSNISMIPYPDMNAILNDGLAHGFRRSMKGSAFIFPLDLNLAETILYDFEEFVVKVPDAERSLIVFEFIPSDKITSVPQTATAFANRGVYGNILFAMGWTKEEHDAECREWTRIMSAKAKDDFQKGKKEMNDNATKDGVGEYFNYDGIGVSGETAFGVNFPRLVELKKKYDPNNVFNKGPKLLP